MAATRCFDADDERFMRAALVEAEGALRRWEVPVGCVVVRDGEIIAVGSNRTNEKRNGTRHAEFEAIDSILALPDVNHDANKAHFNRCDLYVTCEPCIMCAGALSLLGFRQVVFGCGNDKFGGNGSILSVHESGCFPCGEGGRDIDGDGNTGSIVREGSNPESTSNGTHGTDNCSYKYLSYGGLFANQAVKLLQDFYIRGNPKAPKPHHAGTGAVPPLSKSAVQPPATGRRGPLIMAPKQEPVIKAQNAFAMLAMDDDDDDDEEDEDEE